MKLGLKQNVTVPRIFFRYRYLFSVTNFFRYCYLFPGPNVSVTGTSTFSGPICSGTNIGTTQKEENSREFSDTGTKFPGIFRYQCQIVPVPILVLFPGPNFSGTGSSTFFLPNFSRTGTIQKGAKFPGPGCHTLA